MYRITTLFSGPLVTGGGIQQFYFDQGGGTAAQAHAAVRTFWTSIALGSHTSLTITVTPEVELVDNATGQVEGIETAETYTTTGQTAGDPLPLASQGLLRWRTGVYNAGREIRGRTFLPGQVEAASTGGVPSSTTLTSWTNAGLALMNNASSELVVWSRKGQFATVTSASAWSQWATLRSRRD